jgi:hypothetical protein
MSRRRNRTIESEWYDVFADWELADQEAALRTLTELHRQAVRQAQRKREDAPPRQTIFDTTGTLDGGAFLGGIYVGPATNISLNPSKEPPVE